MSKVRKSIQGPHDQFSEDRKVRHLQNYFKKSIDVKISKELEQKFVKHKFWKWKSQLIKTHQEGWSTQKTKQKNAFQGWRIMSKQ